MSSPSSVSAAIPSRIPHTEGARAIAATFVMLSHVGFLSFGLLDTVWTRPLFRGDVAVPMFFALSGLLLTRMWIRAKERGRPYPATRTYFRHRATRILPAYLFCIVFIVATVGRDEPLSTVVQNVFFLQNYTSNYLPDFPQTWSLCVEVVFYLTLPAIGYWIARSATTASALRRIGILALLTPLSLLLVEWPWHLERSDGHSLTAAVVTTHTLWFCGGMVLAVLEPRLRAPVNADRDWWRRPLPWLLALLATYLLVLTPLGGVTDFAPMPLPQGLSREVLLASFAFLFLGVLMLPAISATPLGRFMDSRFLRWFGAISYSFFLWQVLVIAGVRHMLGYADFTGGFWLTLLISFPASLLVAYASWWLLERPFMSKSAQAPTGDSVKTTALDGTPG
ncbi:MAG: acyltransferase [Candidatus Nanopelagicales bacterium]